jgi:hypothetical protein
LEARCISQGTLAEGGGSVRLTSLYYLFGSAAFYFVKIIYFCYKTN